MYIGNTPTTQAFTPAIDYFSGNGVTVAFTLSRQVASVAQVQAVIENVPQSPTDAFTVSGNTITFTSAPPSGTNNIYVYYTSPITQVIAPGQGTVGTAALDPNIALSGQSLTVAGNNISAVNSLGFRNRIINGAMMIDQRNAGASVTPTDAQYTLDRWKVGLTQTSKFSVQQNAGAVAPPAGYANYLGVTSLSSYAVGAGDVFGVYQVVEGYNCADFSWGGTAAVAITLSFWVRSSLTGMFSGSLRNSAANRSYVFTYTVNSANTWEQKSVTIPGDTTGTWLVNNGVGIQAWFSIGNGTTYSTTAGVWTAGNYVSAPATTSLVGTNGATFYITGVQLEAGSVATPFERRPYGTELALCQRYYEVTTVFYSGSVTGGINYYTDSVFAVTKRANPTCVFTATGGNGFLAGQGTVNQANTYRVRLAEVCDTSTAGGYFEGSCTSSAEL